MKYIFLALFTFLVILVHIHICVYMYSGLYTEDSIFQYIYAHNSTLYVISSINQMYFFCLLTAKESPQVWKEGNAQRRENKAGDQTKVVKTTFYVKRLWINHFIYKMSLAECLWLRCPRKWHMGYINWDIKWWRFII